MDLTTEKDAVMLAPAKVVAPKVQLRHDADLGGCCLVATEKRSNARREESGAPDHRVSLPWADFAEQWDAAEDRLTCLERDLAFHDMRPRWICRSDFQEAAALTALRGDAIAMEDLVLVDAGVMPRWPTTSWYVARAIVSLRRHISLVGPAEVLTVDGILDLEMRLASALSHAGIEASETRMRKCPPDRVARWLDAVDELRTTPPLPAAAIALRQWRRIAPLASYNDEIVLLLTSTLLWHSGKTKGLTVCPVAGLQAAALAAKSSDLDDRTTLGSWIAQFCLAIEVSAAAGQQNLQQMTQGWARVAKLLQGHRSNSRLPHLVSLFLAYPVMSARFIHQRLELTASGTDWLLKELMQEGIVVETTGRAKGRVYRLA